MLLFEIWSVGKKPFSQFSNSEVVRQINTGYNQAPPPGCPRAIYKLMVNCWYVIRTYERSTYYAGVYHIIKYTGTQNMQNDLHSQRLWTT